jgi:hypothetical protein
LTQLFARHSGGRLVTALADPARRAKDQQIADYECKGGIPGVLQLRTQITHSRAPSRSIIVPARALAHRCGS